MPVNGSRTTLWEVPGQLLVNIVNIQLQITRIDTQKTGVGQNIKKITLKIRLANANSCNV